jgi:serine/threonine protein phosphatase PrpC
MFQEKKSYTDVFNFLSGTSIVKSKPYLSLDSINNKKAGTSMIQNQNTPFKSFSYQEDKNLKYRQSMEDIGIMIPDLTTDYKVSLFGIFDGHGGNDVVKFVKDRLPQLIKNYLIDLCPVDLAFKNAFSKVDKELKFFDSEYIGTTATLVLFKDNRIYCANVGDSKAYIIYEKTYKQISSDHKCSVEEEAERVRKMGGKISKNRVMGQLILTRTLGDLYVKQFGVINTPDISITDISTGVKYVILASDGVWDVIDLDTLLEMSKAGKSVGEFCTDIVKLSISKGTKDNVSCIVISFN